MSINDQHKQIVINWDIEDSVIKYLIVRPNPDVNAEFEVEFRIARLGSYKGMQKELTDEVIRVKLASHQIAVMRELFDKVDEVVKPHRTRAAVRTKMIEDSMFTIKPQDFEVIGHQSDQIQSYGENEKFWESEINPFKD